ncbi:MAG: histidine--tRNA ligase [Bacillota bacterium]|nr:histidine--tRNA ligase [Bacillota bacterium]
MALSANPVRGTRDFLPAEMRVRDAMQSIILKTYVNNGYQRIHTPMLEDIERLDKSDGGENLNMIFKILKRGQKLELGKEGLKENDLADMGLRFDLTLPLSRYYANNRNELRTPFKVIQIGEVFRAERPQKGRLREFYQCDIDVIGDPTRDAEIELIHTTAKAMQALGFRDFTVRINDRQILFDIIKSAGFAEADVLSVCITFDKLDKIGAEGVKAELEEKAFPPAAIDRFMEILAEDSLSTLDQAEAYCEDKDVVAQLRRVVASVEALAEGKYNIEYDKALVRGMGYYTGTIFEISCAGFAGSVAGGGRYDKMIGAFLGEDIPAVGFSIGFERISEILLNSPELAFETGGKRIGLLYGQEDDYVEVIRRADALRAEGYDVCTVAKGKKVGKQLAALERDGFAGACFFGEEGLKLFG